jgi:murein DD-endopeptidase MepM/ murein hydrolase activator NlpD
MFVFPGASALGVRCAVVTLAGLISIASPSPAQTPDGSKRGNRGKVEQAIPPSRTESPQDEAQPGRPGFEGGQRTDGTVGRPAIGKTVFSALARPPKSDPQDARDRGMIPTGLRPAFDTKVHCRGIDDHWAQDYSEIRGRDAMHGGIDIPAPSGAPIHAIAAGEVISKSLHEHDAQGIQIWLRHRPEDSGLPVWTFSQYTHLIELPDLPVGQRVRMGDVIGKTGNSGISGAEAREGGGARKLQNRRPAVHFAVIYNQSGKYFHNERYVVPLDGWWMDPNAIYRKTGPYDSVSMKALPAAEKTVVIPYMLANGTTVPADTKLIWPYPCSETPLPLVKRNR